MAQKRLTSSVRNVGDDDRIDPALIEVLIGQVYEGFATKIDRLLKHGILWLDHPGTYGDVEPPAKAACAANVALARGEIAVMGELIQFSFTIVNCCLQHLAVTGQAEPIDEASSVEVTVAALGHCQTPKCSVRIAALVPSGKVAIGLAETGCKRDAHSPEKASQHIRSV